MLQSLARLFNLAHGSPAPKNLRHPGDWFRSEWRLGRQGTGRAWPDRPDAGGGTSTRADPRFYRTCFALPAEISRLRESAAVSARPARPTLVLCLRRVQSSILRE